MSQRQRKSRRARRLMHGRTAVGSGLLIAGGLAAGAAQASPPKTVQVSSISGAAAAGDAATKLLGKGKETLTDAILYLNDHGGGTITFASSLSGHTIDLAADLPYINASTTVRGPGAGKLTVNGGHKFSAFGVPSNVEGTNLTVSGLTISDPNGCAMFSDFGNMTLSDSVVDDSSSAAVCGGSGNHSTGRVTLSGDAIKNNHGAGIYLSDDGPLTVSHSLIEGNYDGVFTNGGPVRITDSSVIDNGLGGTFAYGGIRAYTTAGGEGAVTVINSTISGNRLAEASGIGAVGGGIAVAYGVDLTVIGDTITDNEADDTLSDGFAAGGGIGTDVNLAAPVPATLTIEDSVVAGNKVVAAGGASDEEYPDVAVGTDVSGKAQSSLIGEGKTTAETYGQLDFISGDQEGTLADPLKPKLGKLGPEGSKTATAGGRLWVQEPLKGSPLIGKGAAKPFSTKLDPFTTDELGTPRPAKGVTIGAYQVPKPKPKPKKHKQHK